MGEFGWRYGGGRRVFARRANSDVGGHFPPQKNKLFIEN